MFITRAYNDFEIVKAAGTVVKRSSEERLKNEIAHYHSLPSDVSIWFPRLLDSGSEHERYFLELEFYAYDNLGKALIEPKSSLDWTSVAQQLNHILSAFGRHKSVHADLSPHMQQMYEAKTLREFGKLRDDFPTFKTICTSENLVINGQTYLNFEGVWKALLDKGILKRVYREQHSTFFHGDFCLSNILVGVHPSEKNLLTLKCLDPRGKFGELVAWGDPYYDIAKLMHSTEGGYEYFINDCFTVAHKDNEISFEFENDNLNSVHQVFMNELYSKFDLVKARFIEGCIFVGMCARHYDSQNRQLAMYATGIKLLNEVLEDM